MIYMAASEDIMHILYPDEHEEDENEKLESKDSTNYIEILKNQSAVPAIALF